MSDEIDLTTGEPDDEETPAQRRRRERRAARGSDGGSGGGSGRGSGGSGKSDAGLVSELGSAFNKLADQMDARDDEELAEALRDESKAMSQGLVSLTSAIPLLRPFLTLALALAAPILAFWRVGRILFYRFLSWRERRIIAAQQQSEQAAWEEQQQPGMPDVTVVS